MDHYRLARQLSGVVNGTYVGTVRYSAGVRSY